MDTELFCSECLQAPDILLPDIEIGAEGDGVSETRVDLVTNSRGDGYFPIIFAASASSLYAELKCGDGSVVRPGRLTLTGELSSSEKKIERDLASLR